MVGLLCLLEIVSVCALSPGDEILGWGLFLSLAPGIEEPSDGEDRSTQEIHEQILHGVDQADVQISPQAQTAAVDSDILNVMDGDDQVRPCRVQGN